MFTDPMSDTSHQGSWLNDILHMSFLAGIHVFKAFPAYTTTEL